MLCMLPVAFTPARVFLSLVTKSLFPPIFLPILVLSSFRAHMRTLASRNFESGKTAF